MIRLTVAARAAAAAPLRMTRVACCGRAQRVPAPAQDLVRSPA